MCDTLNVSYDRFIRTSEPDHYRASQAIWQAMEERGDLYLDRYEGWYSVRDEAYYDENELVAGEGGEKLSPHGSPVEWTVEESWFFRLSKYQQPLLDHYVANPEFMRPESRRNEVQRFVEGGLNDLSISRTSFAWGVPVPGSPEHVMYVWLDALTNYITGLGYPDDTELWRRYWPANVHLIGKDVVRFHAVYWPAFLMSAGIELPKQVYGHGFLLSRGEKMSKSVGNVVDPTRTFARRRTLQVLTLSVAAIVVTAGLAGPRAAPRNLATVLTWIHFRGLLIVGLLALGNVFCAACPMMLVRDIGRRVVQPDRRWPRALRNKWTAVALLGIGLFAYEYFDLWNLPRATALIVVGYFGVALLVDLSFSGASFCKFVCPIGQFNFVSSTLAPFELQVRNRSTCERCRTVDCLKGRSSSLQPATDSAAPILCAGAQAPAHVNVPAHVNARAHAEARAHRARV